MIAKPVKFLLTIFIIPFPSYFRSSELNVLQLLRNNLDVRHLLIIDNSYLRLFQQA